MVKTVRRIARYEQMKNSETKRFFILNEGWNTYRSAGQDPNWSYQYVNIFGAMQQGVQQQQFEGDTILDPLFKMTISYEVLWNVLQTQFQTSQSQFPPLYVHAWIIAVNDQVSGVSPAPFPDIDPIRTWFLQPHSTRAVMNGDVVTVIKHKKRLVRAFGTDIVTPPASSAGTIKLLKKLKGKKTFEPVSSATPNTPGSNLKGWNYYVVFGWGVPDGYNLRNPLTANPIRVYADRYLYFKDP